MKITRATYIPMTELVVTLTEDDAYTLSIDPNQSDIEITKIVLDLLGLSEEQFLALDGLVEVFDPIGELR